MANFISESFILKDDETKNSIKLYINDKGKIFLTDLQEEEYNPFFITISKEDWEEMKKFVDKEFESYSV